MPKKFSTTVAEAEAKVIQDNESAIVAITEARAKREKIHAEWVEHSKAVKAIEAAWSDSSNDDLPSAEEYARHGASTQLYAKRHAHAAKAVETAEKRIANTDKRVAEIAAQIFENTFPGIAVIGTYAETRVEPSTSELPLMVMRQEGKATTSERGWLEAEVSATYFRDPRIHHELDLQELIARADKFDATVKFHRGHLMVSGFYGIPEIEHLDSQSLTTFAGHVAAEVAYERHSGRADSIKANREGKLIVSDGAFVLAEAGQANVTTEGHTRRVTIDGGVLIGHNGYSTRDHATVASEAFEKVIDGLVHRAYGGLGRVESAVVVSADESPLAKPEPEEAGAQILREALAVPTSFRMASPERGHPAYPFRYRVTFMSTVPALGDVA